MRKALTVALLELRGWRAVPLLALAAGTLPMIAVWTHAPQALTVAVAFLPLLCWAATALAAGASMFTRGLRAGRDVFLPPEALPPRWIWAGKLLAAVTAAGVAHALSILPVWLSDSSHRSVSSLQPGSQWLMQTLLMVGLGHWIALAFSARGWRLVADALVAPALLGTVFWLSLRLWYGGAPPWGTAATMTSCGGVLVLSSLAAVCLGRGAPARSYAAFTQVHWFGLGALLAVQATNLHWIRAVGPKDIDQPLVVDASPDGRWLSIVGHQRWVPRHSSVALLVPIGRPEFVNLGLGAFWEFGLNPAFSLDGKWCAWPVLEWPMTSGSRPVLRVLELRPGARVRSRPTPTRAAEPDAVPLPRLSPTGRGLLLLHPQGRIEVLAGDDLRTLWSQAGVDSAGFLDDETVWVVRRRSDAREYATSSTSTGERAES